MGRGGDPANGGTQAPGRRGAGVSIPAGSWQARDGGGQIEVLWASPEWGHRGVLIRDRLSARMISPEVLRRDFTPANGGGDRIDVTPPAGPETVLRPMIRGGDWDEIVADLNRLEGKDEEANPEAMSPRQADYLAALCERAGEQFDPELPRKEASQAIDRLKAKLDQS